MSKDFFNPYSHGFFRCSAAVPVVALADPLTNAARQIEIVKECHKNKTGAVVFPELSLSGYSAQDLFHQKGLLKNCLLALEAIVMASKKLEPVIITGLPLEIQGALFNSAAVIQGGKILGIICKTYLPNHREFYEKRHFSPSSYLLRDKIELSGQNVPIGNDLIFSWKENPQVKFGVEICEDLWAPVPVSTFLSMAGATIIFNLSASNIVIGKADYRRLLIKSTSGRNICGYVYCGAGQGESTTDMAWDGHAIIAENGTILDESARFQTRDTIISKDIDIEKLLLERMRLSSFQDCAMQFAQQLKAIRTIEFTLKKPKGALPVLRKIDRLPFVPISAEARDERCYETFNIQTKGLVTRLLSTGIKKIVIGISGGLDSTLALLVACRSMDTLGYDRKNIIAVTMPAYATSDLTHKNAVTLMKSLSTSCREIDIRPSCEQMLKDINHPFSHGKKKYDITFENVQAGERTSHLFRIANSEDGLVLGTGDLSELALGWCTYGVGDHMSHYNVNASIPKTLVRHLIAWVASHADTSAKTSGVLHKILGTEISPELVPGKNDGTPAQKTEEFTGPYELQDFNLYYLSRYGFAPSKVAYLSWLAWCHGENAYDFSTVFGWLKHFIGKFFGQSQFKRSCVPDSPKVGSGGSLSPRSDWRAPSDASAKAWLDELHANTPTKVR